MHITVRPCDFYCNQIYQPNSCDSGSSGKIEYTKKKLQEALDDAKDINDVRAVVKAARIGCLLILRDFKLSSVLGASLE